MKYINVVKLAQKIPNMMMANTGKLKYQSINNNNTII